MDQKVHRHKVWNWSYNCFIPCFRFINFNYWRLEIRLFETNNNMKILSLAVLMIAATAIHAAVEADDGRDPPPGTEMLVDMDGNSGWCWNDSAPFDWATRFPVASAADCDFWCKQVDTTGLLGFNWSPDRLQCDCLYEDGMNPVPRNGCGEIFDVCSHDEGGVGPIETINRSGDIPPLFICYRYLQNSESNGDPHCKYYQCFMLQSMHLVQ